MFKEKGKKLNCSAIRVYGGREGMESVLKY